MYNFIEKNTFYIFMHLVINSEIDIWIFGSGVEKSNLLYKGSPGKIAIAIAPALCAKLLKIKGSVLIIVAAESVCIEK